MKIAWAPPGWGDDLCPVVPTIGFFDGMAETGKETGMADDVMGKIPDALKGRVRDVTLSNGKTVRLVKWSLLKFIELCDCINDPRQWERIAVESVRQEDRDLVKDLPADDVLALAAAAREMNLTEAALKNAGSLLGAGQAYREAMPVAKNPSP